MKQVKHLIAHTLPAFTLLLVPFSAHAQLGTIGRLLDDVGELVSDAIPIAVGLGLFGAAWGTAKYIFSAGDEDKRKEGKHVMIASILGLGVFISVWGIIAVVNNALNIDPTAAPTVIPGVPGL